MGVCSVGTEKYEADIGRLISRRIEKLGGGLVLSCEENRAEADIGSAVQLEQWCEAVAELLLMDIAQLHVAYMVNELPLTLKEKKAVLPEAIRLARQTEGVEAVQSELVDYFSGNAHLVLEGYVDFRMGRYRGEWQRCVLKAADELLLDAEYMELMRILAAFVQLRAPRMREVYVILNPDGSCTFTDDNNVRIDYECCTGDGIMSVLVGLAPERITVYDLSGGRSTSLFRDLMRVFNGKVRFFR